MSYPITPDPNIHNLPPAEAAREKTLNETALAGMGQKLLETVINAVLNLLSGGLLGIGGSGFFGLLKNIPILGTFSNLFMNFLSVFGIGGSGPTSVHTLTGSTSLFDPSSILGTLENIPILGPAFDVLNSLFNGLNNTTTETVTPASALGAAGSVATAATASFTTATSVNSFVAATNGLGSSNGGVGGIAVNITPTGVPGSAWL